MIVSGCAINTSTYGTGQTTGGSFAKDIGNIATFGLIDGSDKKEKILYQERTALAIPSKEQYAAPPRPVEGAAKAEASREAAELERIRKAEEQAKVAQKSSSAQLPFEPKKKSLFSRFGVSTVSDTARKGTGDLTEVPPEYRVVQDTPGVPNVDPFAKKKKKKRFFFF